MPPAEFDTYFDERADRFASFYGNERLARALGRGPLFDRLRGAIDVVAAVGATRVLDVGCGSGPLFVPLASRGVRVVGIDPAASMVELARREVAKFPELLTVEQRRWEDIEEMDAYDVAVALGVFDYLDEPAELLRRMSRAAPTVVASFPSPGLRLRLRQVRYGAKGVGVHGYGAGPIADLAATVGLEVVELRALGRAGFLANLRRGTGGAAEGGTRDGAVSSGSAAE